MKQQFSVGNTEAYFSIVVKVDIQGKNCNLEMSIFFAIYTVEFFPVIYDKSSHYNKDFFVEEIVILGFWSFANWKKFDIIATITNC